MLRVTLRSLLALVLVVALVGLLPVEARPQAGAAAAVQAATVDIEIGDFWFCDSGDAGCRITDEGDVDVVTTIQVGDTVVWRQTGAVFHTVSECDATFTDCPGTQEPRVDCPWPQATPVNSAALPGQSAATFSCSFANAGTFYYYCAFHPGAMRGTVVVEAPDNDGDTIPDEADPDDDNDGMPDVFEDSHACLQPLTADAGADPDGDGLTNAEEFEGGSDPCSADAGDGGGGGLPTQQPGPGATGSPGAGILAATATSTPQIGSVPNAGGAGPARGGTGAASPVLPLIGAALMLAGATLALNRLRG